MTAASVAREAREGKGGRLDAAPGRWCRRRCRGRRSAGSWRRASRTSRRRRKGGGAVGRGVAAVGAAVGCDVVHTVSVPFARFLRPQGHRRWRRAGRDESFFELRWKPAGWDSRQRLVVVWRRPSAARGSASSTARAPRARLRVQGRGHQQARLRPRRGTVPRRPRCQQAMFAELKSQCGLGYAPCRRRLPTAPSLSPCLPTDFGRELQMASSPPTRRTTAKRSSLWAFPQLPRTPHRQLADFRPTVSQASSGASRSSARPFVRHLDRPEPRRRLAVIDLAQSHRHPLAMEQKTL